MMMTCYHVSSSGVRLLAITLVISLHSSLSRAIQTVPSGEMPHPLPIALTGSAPLSLSIRPSVNRPLFMEWYHLKMWPVYYNASLTARASSALHQLTLCMTQALVLFSLHETLSMRLKHQVSSASTLSRFCFFSTHYSHLYNTTESTRALTRRIFVSLGTFLSFQIFLSPITTTLIFAFLCLVSLSNVPQNCKC